MNSYSETVAPMCLSSDSPDISRPFLTHAGDEATKNVPDACNRYLRIPDPQRCMVLSTVLVNEKKQQQLISLLYIMYSQSVSQSNFSPAKKMQPVQCWTYETSYS